jgi:hypothetical protein
MQKGFLWLAILCASVTALESAAVASTSAPKSAPAAPSVGYAKGPCDASDVVGMIGKDGILHSNPREAARLIAARVIGCQFVIAKYLTSLPAPLPNISFRSTDGLATPAPRPNANCLSINSNDPVKQFTVLDYCAAWIARYVPAGGLFAAPSPTPAPISNHVDKTTTSNGKIRKSRLVYVFSLATDAPTSAQMSLQMAENLQPHLRQGGQADPFVANWEDTYSVLAAPGWTLAQYQQQCAGDVNTAGAVVVMPPGTASASWNFLLTGNWTFTTVQAMVLDCEPATTTYQNSLAYITDITQVENGKATRVSFSLSTALALASGIFAFHPAKTETFAFTSPSPLPPPGSSYETGYSTGANSNGLGAAAAVGVAALTPLSQTNIGLLAGPDAQLRESLQKSLPKLVIDLTKDCSQGPKLDKDEPDLSQCQWLQR